MPSAATRTPPSLSLPSPARLAPPAINGARTEGNKRATIITAATPHAVPPSCTIVCDTGCACMCRWLVCPRSRSISAIDMDDSEHILESIDSFTSLQLHTHHPDHLTVLHTSVRVCVQSCDIGKARATQSGRTATRSCHWLFLPSVVALAWVWQLGFGLGDPRI